MATHNNLNRYKQVDQKLLNLSKTIKGLQHYFSPINHLEEKIKFLGTRKTPNFKYRKIQYDPKKIEKYLANITIPKQNQYLHKLFEAKRDQISLINKVITSRESGTDRNSIFDLYGSLEPSTINQAKEILSKASEPEEEKTLSAQKLIDRFYQFIKKYRLEGWRISLSRRPLVRVKPISKKILIPDHRLYGVTQIKRIVVHELGAHVLRAANGYLQPFAIFVNGFPGYMATEEGIAAYLEEQAGYKSNERWRDYAARVITVDSITNNKDFRQSFELLKGHNFDDDKAWEITLRVYRGGGFVKDHVYLQGYLKVKNFVASGGDLKKLYIGKIGIKDLDLVTNLLSQEIIMPAKYLPLNLTR